MTGLDVKDLLAAHEGEDYDLYAQTINPQFIKMLRRSATTGSEPRAWAVHLRPEGCRFLDMNGGFGMFNAGRNNPRIRQALIDTLELDTPDRYSPASASSPVCWDASY